MDTTRYRITVRGRLSRRFVARFDGLRLEPGDQHTTLIGEFPDRAHLDAVLTQIADCGLEHLAVEEITEPAPGAGPRTEDQEAAR